MGMGTKKFTLWGVIVIGLISFPIRLLLRSLIIRSEMPVPTRQGDSITKDSAADVPHEEETEPPK